MDFFESLGPIILLIIWAIIAAQARKKKQEDESEQQAPNQPSRPQREQKRGTSLLDTLRERMETLARELEGGSPTPEKQEEEKAKKTLATHDLSTQKTKINHDTTTAVFEPLVGAVEVPPVSTTRQTGIVRRKTNRFISANDFRTEQLRKAIIWSEILQPPVSLRRPPAE
ncbi:MAG: hypothetical protein ACOCW2_01600 [Chitinivibrionales bacterium]